MRVSVTVNDKLFKRRMKKLSALPAHLLDEALTLVKEYTPVQSGYARSQVVKQGDSIVADYPYAARLDQGYSKQAPEGFTKPTIEQLQKDTNKYIRKV
jgi:hypothetical protein